MSSSSEIFGSHVFSLTNMQKHLPKSTFRALQDAVEKGNKLSNEDADVIAQAMMEWAVEKGVTHYTHWFQPMTGLTAQKHDAFFSFGKEDRSIDQFSGSQLIQSEPDASSFPSGGMRTTFEARGYTAWDPSSPVFVMINGDVKVLCIPSVFISYTGHVLDKKTPLMKSTKALNKAASFALEKFTGQKERVHASVGCEQEYFLIDRDYFDQRPDLYMSGRTVLGAQPPKGQQMEDHYFGSIKDRVLAFMEALEERLYMLGVPCKTRHNEVAPHQFETAPIFEAANLAADHNQVTMEVLRKVAREHGLAALLHEKPFAEVNGSGKHVNWSMSSTSSGNLLAPGDEPHHNLIFLYFLVATVNAVHKRGACLRATIAGAGNDHRLGANEAPPAIMSVFLGSHLTNLLDKLEASEDMDAGVIANIDLGLTELPHIPRDNTDRNRTSPFAFTGNKFEFRAVGSSQSISMPVAFLNAAVAESLDEMNNDLAKLDTIDEKSLFAMLRPYIKRSKPVRFEGNNYSDEWRVEAESRGLSNYRTTPEALSIWEDDDVRAFVDRSGILNSEEIDAHYNVRLEHYAKTIDIEANLVLRMIDNHILPAAYCYQNDLAGAVLSIEQVLEEHPSVATQRAHLTSLASDIASLINARDEIRSELGKIHELDSVKEEAMTYAKTILPLMEKARSFADRLEEVVDAREWALPGYSEMLFLM